MKKLILCLAILMVPFTAFGLEMMNNAAMDQVTGQTGVAIVFDDVQAFINVDRFTYIDDDGVTTFWTVTPNPDHGAAFNVLEFQVDTFKANAIIATAGRVTGTGALSMTVSTILRSTDSGYIGGIGTAASLTPLQYSYGSTAAFIAQTNDDEQNKGLNNMTGAFRPQAIAIDISNAAPILSDAYDYLTSGTTDEIAAVCITMPTGEFYMDNINIGAMTLTDNVIVGYASIIGATVSGNSGDSFGAIELEGVTFALLDGWIEIAPH